MHHTKRFISRVAFLSFFALMLSACGGSSSEAPAGPGPGPGSGSGTNTAPSIDGAPATSAQVGSLYSFTPAASDADGDDLSFSIANKPSWADFDTTNGALTGTPNADAAGTFSGIVITVSDGKDSTALPGFSITVNDSTPLPTAEVKLSVSSAPDYSNPASLQGATLSGNVYVFVEPADQLSQVKFYLNDPQMSGDPVRIEDNPPFDFAGSTNPYDTQQLSNATHSITAMVTLADASTEVVSAEFVVANQADSGVARLSWVAPATRTDGSALAPSELGGYFIYYGTAVDQLDQRVEVTDPTATEFTVTGLTAGSYFFAVAAYDAKKVEGERAGPIPATIK